MSKVYPIEPGHAERLAALWSRTGRDWTRNESVAGLWAYAETYEQPVSRLSGSPVAEVAVVLGRAVSGVYNKVMNFRSIDPRDVRAGMSGTGEVDRLVWEEFYDVPTGALRQSELKHEFARLWPQAVELAGEIGDQEALLEREAAKLAQEGFDQLLRKYHHERNARPARPNTKFTSSRTYERSALVIAIAKLRAGHHCEVPNCSHAPFICLDGSPYMEVHHLRPLSEGGEDVLENVVCLCPAHHREVHLGQQASTLTDALLAKRSVDGNTIAHTSAR